MQFKLIEAKGPKGSVLAIVRAIAASALASLALGCAFMILSFFLGEPAEGVWAALVAFAIAFPACLVVGIPAHFGLTKIGMNRLHHYAFVGAVFGLIVLNLFIFPTADFSSFSGLRRLGALWPAHLFALGGGALVGTTFWFLLRPKTEAARSRSSEKP